MSNNNLGVWTYQDSALVLIDYQKEMFDSIRSETRADLVELHARLLAKTATAFKVPIVLSTVGGGPVSHTPGRCRRPRLRCSPSCSATGARRWRSRRSR